MPSPFGNSASRMNLSPMLKKILPSLKVETRILGPCKSPKIATVLPNFFAIERTRSARPIWSSGVP